MTQTISKSNGSDHIKKIKYSPTFNNFQSDIERILKTEGRTEKNEHGQTVFHGYPEALDQMYAEYLHHKAFAPLVGEFRKWNWEWGYNDYLIKLTAALRSAGEWDLILELWSAVVAKRRTNYNKTRKARKDHPDKVTEELVLKTQNLLLESLNQLHAIASELKQEATIGNYLEMMTRVGAGKKA